MKATDIKNIACIGTGTIGASWGTYFAMHGHTVYMYDIKEEQLKAARENIEANLNYLRDKEIITEADVKAALKIVKYTTNLEEAVKDAQLIQESGPEKYDIKRALLADIEKYTAVDTIIASSTSGLLITEIAKEAKHPERCIGGHPYNPPHLIPLVEITRGEKTSEEALKCAYDFYKLIGKEPIILQKETLGFIANRLQMALSREIIDLVLKGTCTIEDVDKAMLYGPGLRMAIMGPILTLHLGGGPGGVRGISKMINDSSNLWLQDMAKWTTIPEEWPDVAQEGVLKEIENRPEEFGKTSEELTKFRDDMLLTLLKLHKKL
jgi:3-hydroxyacyl-CoA dehydrogenase